MTLNKLGMPAMLLSICVALPVTGLAQDDSPASGNGWKHSFYLYLLAPTISGTVGVGQIDGDLEIDSSTVFDSLEAAFLGGYVGHRGDWGVMLDIVYMDLEADFTVLGDRVPGELGNKQFVGMANLLYRLNDRFQLMGGVMYTDVSMQLSLDGPLGPRRRNAGESWADPSIGLRYVSPLSDHWSFSAFGQVGGGVSADLVWQVTGAFSYRMTPRSNLLLGYRYLDFDFESGKGAEQFKFDVSQHGPAVGFRFDF